MMLTGRASTTRPCPGGMLDCVSVDFTDSDAKPKLIVVIFSHVGGDCVIRYPFVAEGSRDAGSGSVSYCE